MLLILLFAAVVFVTYSNGANDNFKGVATLWASGTLSYKQSLTLATIATFCGSICSYFFAAELIKNFSGKGLVPDNIIHSVSFVLSVALAAGITVLIATRLGFPISTTHGIVGALIGSGLVAVGSAVNFSKLGTTFFLPLIAGPLIAIIASSLIYIIFKRARIASGITEQSCVCVGNKWVPVMNERTANFQTLPTLSVGLDTTENCVNQYHGNFLGFKFQPMINFLHCFSAASVSFARGLNDTPKLLGLLLICKLFQMPINAVVLASAMAVGGILNAKRIAETMSKKISSLNHGQGFTANLVTSILVIFASRWGLPVSTTHVSVGSIFGIGIVNKSANKKEVAKIGLSWLMTLPVAALLSAALYIIFHLILKEQL